MSSICCTSRCVGASSHHDSVACRRAAAGAVRRNEPLQHLVSQAQRLLHPSGGVKLGSGTLPRQGGIGRSTVHVFTPGVRSRCP